MDITRDENIDVKKALDIAKKANDSKQQKSEQAEKDMSNYKHGDIYLEEGKVAGIVIEKEHRLEQIAKGDGTLNAVRDLGDEGDILFEKMDGDCHKSDLSQDPALEFIKQHPDSEAAMKLVDVKRAFQDFGMTADGVASNDDPRAKLYQEALEKVRTGEIVLPSVSEYDQQLRDREKRRQEVTIINKPKEPPKVEQKVEPVVETSVDEEVPTIDDKEDDTMNNENMTELIDGAIKEDPLMSASTEIKTPKQEEKKKVLDLAALEDNLYNTSAPKEQPKPEVKEEPVVIEVPESKAETFMQNIPDAVKDKVQTSKVVKVNFTRDINLPKATKRFTNIDGYRRVAPKNVCASFVARILVNSGYIGYFKGCGSLQWSTLSPALDEPEPTIDSGKLAQFCYDQLVSTSLGKISYRKFLEQTSSEDVPAMLHAIMQASLPDEQSVIMACGKRSCQKEFDATYRISELPDIDNIPEDVKKYVARISKAKDIVEDAKEIHDESPVMQRVQYTRNNGRTILVFKHRDLANIIDRAPAMDGLIERYGESAALIGAYIDEIYLNIGKEGEDDDWYRTSDPTIICEELYKLSTTELDEIRAIIQEIPSLETIKYSLKGDFECPHCHTTTHNPEQDIMSLVFQVALKARYLV